mmetsp:Transcript_4854/g.11967  ORF Transcript_4854/g.11967 Transcript_4854/m.11967 type:complete len:81 (+) Transcript_4854:394-636(+)
MENISETTAAGERGLIQGTPEHFCRKETPVLLLFVLCISPAPPQPPPGGAGGLYLEKIPLSSTSAAPPRPLVAFIEGVSD